MLFAGLIPMIESMGPSSTDSITCLFFVNQSEQMWNNNNGKNFMFYFFCIPFWRQPEQRREKKKLKHWLVRCSKDVSNIQSHGIWFSLKTERKKWLKITQDDARKDTRRHKCRIFFFREISVEIMIHDAYTIHSTEWVSTDVQRWTEDIKKRFNYGVIKWPKMKRERK